MKYLFLIAALRVPCIASFSFNAYDLGFQGVYPRQHFHSVPFEPPKPKITQWDSRCGSGNLFLTPRGPSVQGSARGPVILDAKGNLIWMGSEKFEQAMNLNVQQYKGKDYLTFWTSTRKGKKSKHKKHNKKSYVMLDSSYKVAHRIKPVGKGLKADSHEFRITPQGTALITIYYKHQADCTDLKLGKSCWIQDGVFQEIDIETGELIFEWRATDHIGMKDVFSSPSRKDGHGKSKKDAFDFFHINSVDKIDSGDYIISARYMHAIVCISGKTGEILWQLGGKNNNFEDQDKALDFSWQHHVTWQGNSTISIFDNHANNVFHSPSKHSKGMLIELDLEKMTASLLHKYIHPDEILNVSQGSVQLVPESGNVLVGFGNSPTYVEYSAEGEVLCAAHFAPHITFELIDFGLAKSYRIFKHLWVGKPKTVPDVKVKNGKLYVSWNGATKVKSWRLETTKSLQATDDEFVTVKELERDGFETSFELDGIHKYVRVVALNGKRGVLASSAVVRGRRHPSISLWLMAFIIFISAVMFSIVAFIFLYRRFPRLPLRLPQFRRISWMRKRPYTTVRSTDEEYDSESDPLLLNDRSP